MTKKLSEQDKAARAMVRAARRQEAANARADKRERDKAEAKGRGIKRA